MERQDNLVELVLKVKLGLQDHLVPMDSRDQMERQDQMVNQDLKANQEFLDNQELQDLRVQLVKMVSQGTRALKGHLVILVPLGLMVKQVALGLKVARAHRDPPATQALQVLMGPLE